MEKSETSVEKNESTASHKTEKSTKSRSSSKRNKLSISAIIAAQEQKKIIEQASLDLPLTNSGVIEVNLLASEKELSEADQKQKKKKHRKKNKSSKSKEKDSYSDNSEKDEKNQSPLKPSSKSPDKSDSPGKQGKKVKKQKIHLPPVPPQEPVKAMEKQPQEPVEPQNGFSPQKVIPVKRTSSRFSDNLSFSISSDDPFKSIDTIGSTDWRQLSNDSLRREDSEVSTTVSGEGTNDSTPQRKRPRKIITKPTPERPSLLAMLKPASQPQVRPPSSEAAKKYPSPPKEAPPARKSRNRLESDSCSTLSIDNDPLKVDVRRTNDSSTFTTDDSTTSLHEPRLTPTRRARKSPLRINSRNSTQSGEFLSADEIAVVTESDSSDEDENNAKHSKFSRYGPYFSESASSSEKPKKNRPPPLKIDNKPRNREARKINDELERRDLNTPHDPFVIKSDLSCLKGGKEFSSPNWEITIKRLNEPNDAKYIHQMQTMYSMSSILNGLKKL